MFFTPGHCAGGWRRGEKGDMTMAYKCMHCDWIGEWDELILETMCPVCRNSAKPMRPGEPPAPVATIHTPHDPPPPPC